MSAVLMVRDGPIDGGEGPALPLVVKFGFSKCAKKLLSLSGREASLSLTPCLDLQSVSAWTPCHIHLVFPVSQRCPWLSGERSYLLPYLLICINK